MRWGLGRNLWNVPVAWLVQALEVCCFALSPSPAFTPEQPCFLCTANRAFLILVANNRILGLHYLRNPVQIELLVFISPNFRHRKETVDGDMGHRRGHRDMPAVQHRSVFWGRLFLHTGCQGMEQCSARSLLGSCASCLSHRGMECLRGSVHFHSPDSADSKTEYGKKSEDQAPSSLWNWRFVSWSSCESFSAPSAEVSNISCSQRVYSEHC